MRYLITGGAGFIGSNLVKRLLQDDDAEVVVLDNLTTGKRENIEMYLNDVRFSFVQDSILNYVVLEKLVKSCDYVYHLASSVGVKYILNHKLKSLDTIILGTRNVFELCTIYGKRVLFASSSEIYGKNENYIYNEEDDKLLGATNIFRWSYAVGKILGEYYANAFAEKGLQYDIVRFFNVVGIGQVSNYGMVIPTFVKQALNNEEITIYGDGNQIRCFTYIKDVVEICYQISHTETSSRKYYNVGNNEPVSINELADLIIEVSGSKSKKKYIPYKEVYGDGFEDSERRIPSNVRLKQWLGTMEFKSIKYIVEEIVNYELGKKDRGHNYMESYLWSKLISGECQIAIIGLGYVGLPLAISLAKHFSVIGFDINKNKIAEYKKGTDIAKEVDEIELKATKAKFTANSNDLKEASVFIIAVPTDVDNEKKPNLTPLISATELVGKNLKRGAIVIYEPTVYPGVTEEICLRILEEKSGLKCNEDFGIAYSPERINCGDSYHSINDVTKIISASDKKTLETIEKIYATINNAGIFRASSIKVAEAAKVIENCQRDINIAFVNEMSCVAANMGLNIFEIIDAMNTKWNALGFTPGLVGGHCIGIDSYYLLDGIKKQDIEAPMLQLSRRVNEEMVQYVVSLIVKELKNTRRKIHESKVGILGVTFKDNCLDIRNSKSIELYNELKKMGMCVKICDEDVRKEIVNDMYHIDLNDMNELENLDVLVIAVSNKIEGRLGIEDIKKMFNSQEKKERIMVDLKGVYADNIEIKKNFNYNVV